MVVTGSVFRARLIVTRVEKRVRSGRPRAGQRGVDGEGGRRWEMKMVSDVMSREDVEEEEEETDGKLRNRVWLGWLGPLRRRGNTNCGRKSRPS